MENKLLYLYILLKIKVLLDIIKHIQNNFVPAKIITTNNNILTSEDIVRYNIDLYKIQNTKVNTAPYKKNEISFVIHKQKL